MPVVLINGARQTGKSTLVRLVAGDRLAERRDLDRAQDRAAAIADPVGFVDSPELLVIDEIQRAPELLLAIEAAADEDPRPGRYLLTGSSRLFGMVAAPDALPGRMETVELWPLSQGELDAAPDGFVDALFAFGPDLRHESEVTRTDYAARIVRGGLPEATTRTAASGSSTPTSRRSSTATSANCPPSSTRARADASDTMCESRGSIERGDGVRGDCP
nr:AAA family ATPase [Micromonospora sp. KC207]